jgi:transcription initiation factor TFIIIB Brf1 subunit/transcription initiation factor TFIIB
MCIVVVQDLEDTKKIWHKAEDNSTNDTRNGNPSYLTLYDQGLATTIGNTNRDASGNVIDSMMVTRLNKTRFQDKGSQINKSARNLIGAFRQLDSLKINLV